MAIGDVPLTPLIDPVTGTVTEIGRIYLRTLSTAVGALAPLDALYWVSRSAPVLTADVNLGALPSGYLKIATAVGQATPATVATIPQADVTGLTAALAGKANVPIAESDVTGLVADLASKAALAGGNAFTGAQTIAGTVSVTANSFTLASTAGANLQLNVRNPLAGSTNSAEVSLGNDAQARTLIMQACASTYGPNGLFQPNGGVVTTQGAGGLAVGPFDSAPLRLATANQERMRITPTGEVLINNQIAGSSAQLVITSNLGLKQHVWLQDTVVAAGGYYMMFLNSTSGLAGGVLHPTETTVNFLTSSDARLKHDQGRAIDLAALRAVVVHDFAWIADDGPDRGVFAQEAHALFPRAVVAGTDERTAAGTLARPWQIDYSKFVADLIVGWQAHDATLADLRAALADCRARLEERRSEHGAL